MEAEPATAMLRAYLAAVLALLALALLALPWLEPGTPSYTVDLTAIALLVVLAALITLQLRRTLRATS